MSSLSAPLVRGPVRPGRVVAAARLGCYVLVDGGAGDPVAGGTVLPVLAPGALALPTAARLPGGALPACEVGDRVEVGQGRIAASGWVIEVVRTFRPSRVRRHARGTGPGPSSDDGHANGSVLRALLATRLGLGPGLTPEGDDELAGHLLVAAATGAPVPDLEPHLHRTTALSASLLSAAAQGYAAPTVVAYVDAALAEDHLATARLRPTIEAIGHTSGPALLRGIHAAAGIVHTTAGPLPTAAAGADLNERTVA